METVPTAPAAVGGDTIREPTHARLHRLRLGVSQFVALVGVAALVSLFLPATWSEPVGTWWPAFIVLTALSVALEFVAVPLPRGGALSVATISQVATLLVVPAPFAALSIGISVLIEELIRRPPLIKIYFNTASFVLTASLASFALGLVGNPWRIVHAAVGGSADAQFQPFALIIVAGAIYYVVNLLLTSAIISIASGYRFAYLLRANSRTTLLSELGAETIGGLFAFIWIVEPFWTVWLAVPTAVISRSLSYIQQLQTETRSAVRSLAQIVDHRDATTYHHSERVAVYATALARELRLDEDEIETIEQAASVHDLGKIGVADAVLLKPGPLDEAERTAMWLHTEIGAQIVGRFQQFRAGASIVLHHHERYDGSGYPGRLAGEAIPFGARVVAVADAFDAMTSDRPYRAALTIGEAVDRLRHGAGTQWDPVAAQAFLRLIEDGRLEVPGLPPPDLAVKAPDRVPR